jgi:hypothetical protein
MKKLIVVVLVCSFLAAVSHAQDSPKIEVDGGYSLFYVVKGLTLAMNGGRGSVTVNANNWLGVVGDFGAYHASPASLTLETYTFGPRFSYRKKDRFAPFAQALLGGAHGSAVSGGFTGTNSFVFGGGGGVDIGLGKSGKYTVRPQMGYFGFRTASITTNTVRLSVAISYRFGKK